MTITAGVKKYLEEKSAKTLAQKISSLIEGDMTGVTYDGMKKATGLVEADMGRTLTEAEKENGFGPEWPIVRFSDGSACDFSGDWAPVVVK